jgi:hypothetical protein
VDRCAGLWNLPVSEASPESSVLAVRYLAARAASVAKHSSWVDAAPAVVTTVSFYRKVPLGAGASDAGNVAPLMGGWGLGASVSGFGPAQPYMTGAVGGVP